MSDLIVFAFVVEGGLLGTAAFHSSRADEHSQARLKDRREWHCWRQALGALAPRQAGSFGESGVNGGDLRGP